MVTHANGNTTDRNAELSDSSRNEAHILTDKDGTRYNSVHLNPFFNMTFGNSRGVNTSIFNNVVSDKMRGMQLSGFSNIAGDMRGAQLSTFSNVSKSPLYGLQLSAVSNIAMGVGTGTQLSLLTNISSNEMHGVQMGMYNYADTVHGVQIGLFNVCSSKPHGTQVGIVNYNSESPRRSIGLINLCPSSKLSAMLFSGNMAYVNVALEIQNGHIYNIVGVGMKYPHLDDFAGDLFYRIGYKQGLTDRLSLGADIGYHHLETFKYDTELNDHNHMFSLQPRLTADYKLRGNISAYASAGYEMTHKYDGEVFRRGLVAEAGLKYRLRPYMYVSKATTHRTHDYLSVRPDSDNAHPWIAAAEVFGINTLVHCFDRFVLCEDYSKTTLNSIRRNFKMGFVWDNDNFSTNLFFHPYHGNLYFNSARSNGLTFWQSVPYALGGSLMWEFFGEDTPPSVNDVFCTTMGGVAIGETAFRLSSLPLDDSKRGSSRFFRELLAFAINPIRGINRLITGDAWRVRRTNSHYHDYNKLPVNFDISVGHRYVADNNSILSGDYNAYVNLIFNYGDVTSNNNKPYDFFSADFTFNIGSQQPLISNVHLLGMLYGKYINSSKDVGVKIGVFQHFNFYNSEPTKDGSGIVPYRISEAAAAGPGAIFHFPKIGNLTHLEQRVFLDGIFMGGSQTDHYHILNRDYNLGSGYSAKVHTFMEFGKYGRMVFKSELYHLFTWKGYDEEKISQLSNLEYTNAQGDPGNTILFTVNPHIQLNITKHLMFDLFWAYYLRHTNYKSLNDKKSHTHEIRTGLSYTL